ncbi:uncharacterized protein LOC128921573 [Zeugodacus cucurbitae]|uniref:uncharacterized protein LOC128921573 n=1 Tax=Zeugodacus cucurbitae TaxID=28588 RepID=UPI0023D95B04|nr:uncharacterized protein LOC128921573 [Zeugodacus cucurbitae]
MEWPLFSQLEFLRENVKPRKMTSSISETESSSGSANTVQYENYDDMIETILDDSMPPELPSTSENSRSKKRDNHEVGEHLITFMDTMKEIVQKRSEKSKHDSFLQMVGEKICELPEKEQDEVEKIYFKPSF